MTRNLLFIEWCKQVLDGSRAFVPLARFGGSPVLLAIADSFNLAVGRNETGYCIVRKAT